MCEFCKDYSWFKQEAKTAKKEKGLNKRIYIAMKIITTKDRIRRGLLTTGRYKAVFCPVCGRKLSEVK